MPNIITISAAFFEKYKINNLRFYNLQCFCEGFGFEDLKILSRRFKAKAPFQKRFDQIRVIFVVFN